MSDQIEPQDEGEVAKLRRLLSAKVMDATLLREVFAQDGDLFMTFEGGAAGLLAQGFHDILARNPDANYVEMTFQVGGLPVAVTVQRADRPTPHQLRRKAEQELEEARSAVQRGCGQAVVAADQVQRVVDTMTAIRTGLLPQGHDDRMIADIDAYNTRYGALRGQMSFSDAARMAQVELVERILHGG